MEDRVSWHYPLPITPALQFPLSAFDHGERSLNKTGTPLFRACGILQDEFEVEPALSMCIMRDVIERAKWHGIRIECFVGDGFKNVTGVGYGTN